MTASNFFYKKFNLKRVYYSGYVPISYDKRLPSIGTEVPMLRENRLYQTDWLMRFYGFNIKEILNESHTHLDLDIDPKLSWALRNMHYFPIDVNKASKHLLARVPGFGMRSVYKILKARQHRKLNWDHLKTLGCALNRAKYFVICNSNTYEHKDYNPNHLRSIILQNSTSKYRSMVGSQLNLFS